MKIKDFTPEQIAEAVRLYKYEEQTLLQVGKHFNTSGPTIRKVLLAGGAEIKGRGRPKKHRLPTDASNYSRMSAEQIANVQRERISKDVKFKPENPVNISAPQENPLRRIVGE